MVLFGFACTLWYIIININTIKGKKGHFVYGNACDKFVM